MAGFLGQDGWRAIIAERGGSRIVGELDPGDLNLTLSRPLSDFASASVTATKPVDVLRLCEPWATELHLWSRGRIQFAGPVVGRPLRREGLPVTVQARDVFAWLERRFLSESATYAGDVARVFHGVVEAAMLRDPSPGLDVQTADSGVSTSVTIDGTQRRRAADVLRDLVRTGVDFVVIGRTLYAAGGVDPGVIPAIPLVSDDVWDGDGPTVDPDGLQSATEVTFRGQGDSTAVAGGVSDRYGLLQTEVSAETAADAPATVPAARVALADLDPALTTVTGQLSKRAPVDLHDLVPGRTVLVRCTDPPVDGVRRVSLVSVQARSGGVETVTVTLVPAGVAS